MTTHTTDRIVYEVEGHGDPVLLVHGLGGSSNTWSAMLGAFDGHRTVRLDLPGSGRSSRFDAPLTIADYVEAVRRVAAAAGIGSGRRVHLVGHSMGCIVALHLAAEDPAFVHSLALFGPLLTPSDPAKVAIAARGAKARAEGTAGMQAIADMLLETAVSARTRRDRRAAAAFVRESLMRQSPEGYAASCEALAGSQAVDPAAIGCPTLLVTGDEDRVAPPDAVRDLGSRLRDARVVILPGCGHWHPIELPDECQRLAADFIARADRQAVEAERRRALEAARSTAATFSRATVGAVVRAGTGAPARADSLNPVRNPVG